MLWKKKKNLLWDMRPPGPLADSNKVTPTPFLPRIDAHTAPETKLLNNHLNRLYIYLYIHSTHIIYKKMILLPLPNTATLVVDMMIRSMCLFDGKEIWGLNCVLVRVYVHHGRSPSMSSNPTSFACFKFNDQNLIFFFF